MLGNNTKKTNKTTLRKKPCKVIDVINFSATDVSTGQVGAYIKKLYKEEGFLHIGYRCENSDGELRFILYTLPNANNVISYFKDRCPAMVESEIKKLQAIHCQSNTWDNGFEEISAD